MAEQQQERGYVSTDPNFGQPVEARGYVSTDPNFGEPVKVRSRTWADSLGLNEPTDSRLVGFLRGAGTGAVDLVQGAVANVTGQMNSKLDAENAIRREAELPETATAPRVEQPEGLSGAVGSALPVMGEMALGGAPAARQIYNAIPRTARAGEKFQEVMGAAKNIPIETQTVGDVALRIQQLADRGSSMPLAVRKLLLRMTDPNKAAMTYEESRDFASNIGRLSVDEMKRLTPVVRREVAHLAAELNLANANAAQKAGKLMEYKSAMHEYAQAMRMKELAEQAVRAAKKIAPIGAAAGAADWYLRR